MQDPIGKTFDYYRPVMGETHAREYQYKVVDTTGFNSHFPQTPTLFLRLKRPFDATAQEFITITFAQLLQLVEEKRLIPHGRADMFWEKEDVE